MNQPIPSPLLGGQFPAPPEITDKDVEEFCKKFQADSAIVIVFRRHQEKCEDPHCAGLHSDGGYFNINHAEAHYAVDMIKDRFELNSCEENGTDTA